MSFRRRLLRAGAAVPGVAASALPVGVCPACWPVYAGILSALGVAPALSRGFGWVLLAGALMVSVALLLWRAPSRRGYGPGGAGAVAAGMIVLGKLRDAAAPAVWVGAALLVAASLWNAWPRKTTGEMCPNCVPPQRSPRAVPPRGNTRTLEVDHD